MTDAVMGYAILFAAKYGGNSDDIRRFINTGINRQSAKVLDSMGIFIDTSKCTTADSFRAEAIRQMKEASAV